MYRLLYKGTAEHRVYRRNVDKEGLFLKVVDKETVKGIALLHHSDTSTQSGAVLPHLL